MISEAEKKTILIVEDDELERELCRSILTEENYQVMVSPHSHETFNLIKDNDISLIIIDITLPFMAGIELIKKINTMENKPIILVQSAIKSSKKIIEIMKMGIFDYLIKPINREELLFRSRQAILAHQQRLAIAENNEDQINNIRRMIQWNVWQEGVHERNSSKYEQSLFYSLKTNFCQGAGIGTLVSILGLIAQSAVLENQKYIIDQNLMEMVLQNAAIANATVREITWMADMVDNDPRFQPIGILELLSIVRTKAQSLQELAAIKNQRIAIKRSISHTPDSAILVSQEMIEKAIGELLINAMKFSLSNSKIIIFLKTVKRNLVFTIQNRPETFSQSGTIEGIPLEYETLVFDPFFRIANVVYEDFRTLDLGLGLTMVKHIISQHNGIISAYNVSELSENKTTNLVNVSFQLPIVDISDVSIVEEQPEEVDGITFF